MIPGSMYSRDSVSMYSADLATVAQICILSSLWPQGPSVHRKTSDICQDKSSVSPSKDNDIW